MLSLKPVALTLLLAAVCLSQAGCISLSAMLGMDKKSPTLDTSLLEAQGYSIPPGGMPSPVQADPGAGPRVVLEIRGEERHLESVPLPMDRSVCIEDLVQQAQLHDQLGKLRISIMRPNGSSPPVRLDTKTNKDGKVENLGQNYGLLPGDHIIILVDNRTQLERFVDDKLMDFGK